MTAPGRGPRAIVRHEDLAGHVASYIGRHPGCTATQLSAEFSRSREYITRAARDLVDAGLVARVRDLHDGRVFRYVPAGECEPPAEVRRCARCKHPLPPYRKRFCSEICYASHRKKERDTRSPDYAAWVSGLITRMGTRAIGDLEAVEQLAGLTGVINDALEVAVKGTRAQGYSDAHIGDALGITKQAVQKRFPRQPKVVT